MKARIMLRESNETLKEGYGFANQREDCLAFAPKLGLEVVQEHQIVERSTVWNRQKFLEVVDEAIRQRGEVPAIVFPRVDRFARNLEAAGYYLGCLRQNDLVVIFAQEALVVDNEASAMQVLMFFIHSFKADQDARQIARNTAGGRNKLAEVAKEVPNGMVIWPFDYLPKRIYGRMVTGKPSVNQERAAWVRKWVDWILDEGLSVSEVCRRMNQALVPPPRQGRHWKGAAKEWHRSNVTDILRSRQLLGEFSWGGQVYLKDDSLRILSEERFEALQKRLDENRERSYYNAAKYDYPPLRKVVFHGCGHLMYGIPASGIPYYRCPKCKREWINAKKLWANIERGIRDALLREERIIPAIRKQFDNKETIEHLQQEIKVKAHEIAGWEDAKDKAFSMGMELHDYPPDRVQSQIDRAEEKIQRVQAEKAELERRLATIRQQILNEEGIRRFCRLAANNLDNLTKDQWEILLRLLKLRVTVHSKNAIAVNVALPPVRDGAEIELSRSLGNILWAMALKASQPLTLRLAPVRKTSFIINKMALHRAYAEDAVAYENEERIKRGNPIYTEGEYWERVAYFTSRMPYKLFKCRYHSFQRYFHWLKQLGWTQFTGKEEKSSIQEHYPDAPPRRYYRLTQKGLEAPDYQWSNPQLTLYPERGLEYFREKRKNHRYSRKAPTRSRRARTV